MNYKVLEIPGGIDLADFATFLWDQEIPHRIRYEAGNQELWLADPADREFVLQQFERWQQGEALVSAVADKPSRKPQSPSLLAMLVFVPVTFALLVISLLLTLLTGFGHDTSWLHWFTFVDFKVQGKFLLFQSLETLLASGQYWRLITPVFLHFSLLHLVFNLLWTYELGRRIEFAHQRWVVVVLVLVMGITSNIAQFVMTGPMFGGLSGVIFGMMAYTWLWDRISKDFRFGLPPMLMIFMLLWLILGISGLFESMGMGAVANMAHLVGLLSGLACAPVVYYFRHRVWRTGR